MKSKIGHERVISYVILPHKGLVCIGLYQIEYCLQGWLMLISHRKVKQETVVISLGLYLWSPYGLAIPFGLGINSTIRSDEELTYASFMLISRYSIHILSWSSQRCVHKGAYSANLRGVKQDKSLYQVDILLDQILLFFQNGTYM